MGGGGVGGSGAGVRGWGWKTDRSASASSSTTPLWRVHKSCALPAAELYVHSLYVTAE